MAELIFDVGMHNGDDTAQYLAHGYDVVAVDANPALCEAAQARFADEIAAGRLVIRNVGVSNTSGELTFWISEHTDWSSFSQEWATRRGASAEPLQVPVVRFSDLLNEYRKPLYAKIDIEGSDLACLEELQLATSLPAYLSFELPDDATFPASEESIASLVKLGYDGFKCVRQNDWALITPENLRRYTGTRRALGIIYPLYRRLPAVLRDRIGDIYTARLRGDERFAVASSGPLGRDIPGRWLTAEEIVEVARGCHSLDVNPKVRRLPEQWFDIHARHESAG